MRTVTVRCTWTTVVELEIPDDVWDGDVRNEVDSLQEWAADQIDSRTAELTDWEIRSPIKETHS